MVFLFLYHIFMKKDIKNFTVEAIYDNIDRGSFFRDDYDNLSIKPGASAKSYRVLELHIHNKSEFTSPEEVILYLHTIEGDNYSLSLQMNNRESDKFIKIWQTLNQKYS